ncbi:hypothetical protein LG302_03690 [Halomonas organivorans]
MKKGDLMYIWPSAWRYRREVFVVVLLAYLLLLWRGCFFQYFRVGEFFLVLYLCYVVFSFLFDKDIHFGVGMVSFVSGGGGAQMLRVVIAVASLIGLVFIALRDYC